MLNLVGFQTSLRRGEQERIFKMIPGLANVEFLRYGMIHRNTFINAPDFLNSSWQFKQFPNTFMAGQVAGVEGYVESAASGMMAGIGLARLLLSQPSVQFPVETAMGALAKHISTASRDFQPMNVNFGLFSALEKKFKGSKAKKEAIVERSIENIQTIKKIIL